MPWDWQSISTKVVVGQMQTNQKEKINANQIKYKAMHPYVNASLSTGYVLSPKVNLGLSYGYDLTLVNNAGEKQQFKADYYGLVVSYAP
jgi:hypothetical protein